MRVIMLSIVLLCLVGAAMSPLCAGQIVWSDETPLLFVRQPQNIKGDVLILDVGSLWNKGRPSIPSLNDEGCADTCARTPGCNAWAFCTEPKGCGSGCAAYVASNSPLRPASDNSYTNPAWYNLTAITAFGPWGVTAGCQSVCNNGHCTPGDAWPYGMCTLKKLQNSDKPEVTTDAGEGWVSGFIKQPPECAGIPVRTCTSCLRSKAPSSCLNCARTPFFKVGLLEGAQEEGVTKADACSTCFNTSAPAQCIECLSSDAPCAECALMQYDPGRFDVDACLNCSQRHGENFTSACIDCAFLGKQPQRVRQCMQSLR